MRLRHKIERSIEALLILAAVWCAVRGNWAAGQYFLMATAVVELDEWLGP